MKILRNVHEITYTTCPLSLWESVRVRVLNAQVISCTFLTIFQTGRQVVLEIFKHRFYFHNRFLLDIKPLIAYDFYMIVTLSLQIAILSVILFSGTSGRFCENNRFTALIFRGKRKSSSYGHTIKN